MFGERGLFEYLVYNIEDLMSFSISQDQTREQGARLNEVSGLDILIMLGTR